MIARARREAWRDEGQAAVLTVIFLVVLLGMSAMAIDVGTWYHEKRALQAEVDAAALAGAQALPEDVGQARALAMEYAKENGGDLNPDAISITGDIVPDDTINIHMSKDAPGFFSRVLGISSVTVGAKASARSDTPAQALGVAPIVVNWKHPKLQCGKIPCAGQTEIDLLDLKKPGGSDAAGAFGLIDLAGGNGSVAANEIADWITSGFDAYLAPGDFNSVPSAKFNSVEVRDAMEASIGKELLFPVYKQITGPGSNAVYVIIGFVGFKVSGFNANGSNGAVYGEFVRFIAQGIQVTKANEVTDFGVRSIQLVN